MKPSLYPIIGLWAFMGRVKIQIPLQKEKHSSFVEMAFREQRLNAIKK